MLDQEISDLLAYAQNGLLLDELDVPVAARRICRLLKITDFSPTEPTEEVDGYANPNKLVAPLLEYAAANGIADGAAIGELKAEIMDAVMLKPSEVGDLFEDTYSVNKQKAFDWLYEYSLKSGYVDLDECAKNDRWEAKELKSRIEIIIDLMPRAQARKYPKCPLCAENVGYIGRANMRTVGADIGGEDWFFAYSRHQYFDKHGVLVNGEHKPASTVGVMKKLAYAADFIGADGFVCVDPPSDKGGASNTVHEHFKTGFRGAPMLRGEIKTKLKSREYPYLEMGLVDWYSTVIRFAHSNLEKVTEFAEKLAGAWKNYSDERINNDGSKNFCSVVCRKINGKYTFDMVLRSTGMKPPRMAAEFNEIKASALSITDILGYFVLPTKLSEELKLAQQYLDGTLDYTSAAASGSVPLAKTVDKLLKAQGGTVSRLEAKLNLHDAVDAVCEKILSSTAVFENDGRSFFESLGIDER